MKILANALVAAILTVSCVAQDTGTSTATKSKSTSASTNTSTSTDASEKHDDGDIDKGRHRRHRQESEAALSLPVVAPTWLMLLILTIVVLQVWLLVLFFLSRKDKDMEQALEKSVAPLRMRIDQINNSLAPVLAVAVNRLASAGQYPFGPRITAVTPNRGKLAGGTDVRVSGHNFSSDMQVWFGGTLAPLQPGPTATEFTVRTPQGAAGEVDVYVVTASDIMSQRGVTYRYVDFRLDGVALHHGRLRLNGAGFAQDTEVWIDNQQIQPVQFVDDGHLEVTLPDAPAHPHNYTIEARIPAGDRSQQRTYHYA